MKRKLLCVVVLGALLNLYSCDYYHTQGYVIENTTNYAVLIEADGNYPYIVDTATIPAHAELVIGIIDRTGKRPRSTNSCNVRAESLKLKISGNDTLQVNLSIEEDSTWTYYPTGKESPNGYACHCRLVIDSSQIQ